MQYVFFWVFPRRLRLLNFRRPRKYPKENILHNEYGESLKPMVNSFAGSVTEIPSPCGTGRTADGTLGHTTVRPLHSARDVTTNSWHHAQAAVSPLITWLPPHHSNSKQHRVPSAGQPLRTICCTLTAGTVRAGPTICLGGRSYTRNTNDTPFSL